MGTQLRKRYFSLFLKKRERERAICFARFFETAFRKVLWEISALENTCGFAKVCRGDWICSSQDFYLCFCFLNRRKYFLFIEFKDSSFVSFQAQVSLF